MFLRHFIRISFFLTLSVLLCTGCQTAVEKKEEPLLFFPPPPAKPRIQFLTWASGAAEVVPEKSSFEKFTLGEEKAVLKILSKPYGIAARDGAVYVCDTKALNVTCLDFIHQTYTFIGVQGAGRFRKPINIIVDPLNYKFVADPQRKQVLVFTPENTFATAFSIPEPCKPVDVACYGNELFVLDNDDTPQVVVLDRSTGKVLRSFGSLGIEEGQFRTPNSLCVDPEGNLYVSDTMNNRIQKMTRTGEVIWTRGNAGYRLGQFGRPRGIRCGPDGIVYVVDTATEIVQMFDPEGRILMRFGGPGEVPGALYLPSTLWIDKTSIPYFKKYAHKDFKIEYLIFVANQYGKHFVNVYAFGSFPEGYQLSESEIAVLPEVNIKKTIGAVEDMPEKPEGNEQAPSKDPKEGRREKQGKEGGSGKEKKLEEK